MAQKDAFSHLRRGRVERNTHQPRQPCRKPSLPFFSAFRKNCVYSSEPVLVKMIVFIAEGVLQKLNVAQKGVLSAPNAEPTASATMQIPQRPTPTRLSSGCKKTVAFLSFLYVCPEPVLVKRSF
jgi:hypothetical protein